MTTCVSLLRCRSRAPPCRRRAPAGVNHRAARRFPAEVQASFQAVVDEKSETNWCGRCPPARAAGRVREVLTGRPAGRALWTGPDAGHLAVKGTGSGGVDELAQHLAVRASRWAGRGPCLTVFPAPPRPLLQEDEAAFGVFKVVGVDERENVTSRRPKYIGVTYIGPKVRPPARAARAKPERLCVRR
jgi:hypothetical protein